MPCCKDPEKEKLRRKKLSLIAHERRLGTHIRTDEIKNKMYTSERANKLSKLMTGRKLSEDTKNKIGNANFKTGYYYDNGYKRMGTKGTPEHRTVWERLRGPIPNGHEIHHINGVRDDNRVKNLMCLSKSEHTRLHWKTDKAIGGN